MCKPYHQDKNISTKCNSEEEFTYMIFVRTFKLNIFQCLVKYFRFFKLILSYYAYHFFSFLSVCIYYGRWTLQYVACVGFVDLLIGTLNLSKSLQDYTISRELPLGCPFFIHIKYECVIFFIHFHRLILISLIISNRLDVLFEYYQR